MKKLIDLCHGPRNELAFESPKEKEVWWCHIMAERPRRGTFEREFFHSGQVPF
jgi:hypothetical protein